jgi:hypothetical protein
LVQQEQQVALERQVQVDMDQQEVLEEAVM